MARDLTTISGVMSIPMTRPLEPTWVATMNESNRAPDPTSTTRSPGWSRPRENGLPTPAKDSTARSGSPSSTCAS